MSVQSKKSSYSVLKNELRSFWLQQTTGMSLYVQQKGAYGCMDNLCSFQEVFSDGRHATQFSPNIVHIVKKNKRFKKNVVTGISKTTGYYQLLPDIQ